MTARAHESVWELLPWFVNASLEDGELRQVGKHLVGCEECRREVGYLRNLSQTLASSEGLVLSPEAALDELMSKIQESERDRASRPRRHTETPGTLGKLKGLIRQSPVEIRWLMAGQAGAAMLLLGLLLWPRGSAPGVEKQYRTLSDPVQSTAPQATTQRLRMVFQSDVKERVMREVVLELDATIVAGPTPFGVYTLELKSPLGAEELARLLEELRARGEVTFVELLP